MRHHSDLAPMICVHSLQIISHLEKKDTPKAIERLKRATAVKIKANEEYCTV